MTKEIEKFTVGRDREMDLYLAKYDVLGSMAHITMLQSIDLLTADELKVLLKELKTIYQETASYGHFGRKTERVVKHFTNRYQGDLDVEVTLFPWEETERYQEEIKREFGVS